MSGRPEQLDSQTTFRGEGGGRGNGDALISRELGIVAHCPFQEPYTSDLRFLSLAASMLGSRFTKHSFNAPPMKIRRLLSCFCSPRVSLSHRRSCLLISRPVISALYVAGVRRR